MTRAEVLERFRDAAREVWGERSAALLNIDVGEDEPKTVSGKGGAEGVLAALVDAGEPWAVGRTLVRRSTQYRLLVANRLLVAEPEFVRRILLHEAVHIGYRSHTQAFRDVVREVGGAVSESAAGGEKIRIQKKVGARYQTVREFDDEHEALRWGKEQQRAEPGSRWRMLQGMEEEAEEETVMADETDTDTGKARKSLNAARAAARGGDCAGAIVELSAGLLDTGEALAEGDDEGLREAAASTVRQVVGVCATSASGASGASRAARLGDAADEKITPERLATIKVLWRQPDLMTLWGIPYDMRPGQSPYDIWKGRTLPDTEASARGIYGRTISDPGPGKGWMWLGQPGWWGHLSADERRAIEAFLAAAKAKDDIPNGPAEWSKLGAPGAFGAASRQQSFLDGKADAIRDWDNAGDTESLEGLDTEEQIRDFAKQWRDQNRADGLADAEGGHVEDYWEGYLQGAIEALSAARSSSGASRPFGGRAPAGTPTELNLYTVSDLYAEANVFPGDWISNSYRSTADAGVRRLFKAGMIEVDPANRRMRLNDKGVEAVMAWRRKEAHIYNVPDPRRHRHVLTREELDRGAARLSGELYEGEKRDREEPGGADYREVAGAQQARDKLAAIINHADEYRSGMFAEDVEPVLRLRSLIAEAPYDMGQPGAKAAKTIDLLRKGIKAVKKRKESGYEWEGPRGQYGREADINGLDEALKRLLDYIDVAPDEAVIRYAAEAAPSRFGGELYEGESTRRVSMTYGTLPTFEAVERHMKGEGYSYELRGSDEALADRLDLPSAGSFSPEELYGILEKLTAAWSGGDEQAGDLASSILETLDFEWV